MNSAMETEQNLDIMEYDYIILKLRPEEYLNIVHHVNTYQSILQNNRSKQKNKYKPETTPRRVKPDLTIHEVMKDGVIYDITYTEQ